VLSPHIPKGYNIVVGKLSFEITKTIDPQALTPTLVATDVTRLAVTDGENLRRLSIREGLRLFGYPDHYILDGVSYQEYFDLLGNTVVVPVIKEIAKRITADLCQYDIYNYKQSRQAILHFA
jgi:DNA (cytosine-5)-methyltransferase 1